MCLRTRFNSNLLRPHRCTGALCIPSGYDTTDAILVISSSPHKTSRFHNSNLPVTIQSLSSRSIKVKPSSTSQPTSTARLYIRVIHSACTLEKFWRDYDWGSWIKTALTMTAAPSNSLTQSEILKQQLPVWLISFCWSRLRIYRVFQPSTSSFVLSRHFHFLLMDLNQYGFQDGHQPLMWLLWPIRLVKVVIASYPSKLFWPIISTTRLYR